MSARSRALKLAGQPDDDLTVQLRATLIALGQPVDVEDYAPPVGVPVDLDGPR